MDPSCSATPKRRRPPETLTAPEAEAIRANPKQIMTLPEAAAYLCHCPRKLRDLVKLRRLPAMTLAGDGRGKLLFRLTDLNRLLEQATRPAT